MKTTLCFSCNETYMPLCKGLILSLTAGALRFVKHQDISLNFININCGYASLDWLETVGVHVHDFARECYLPGLPTNQLPQWADAQLCRPFLPSVIPGYDCYIWIDCDTWIQGTDVLSTVIQCVSTVNDKILLCPDHHYGYLQHRNKRYPFFTQGRWYRELYSEDIVAKLSFFPMFNSGFFAMQGKSPLWDIWAKELTVIYSKSYSESSILHLAEQLALNRIIYEMRAFIPLDPIFNYACGGSSIFLNSRDKLVVGYPPYQQIKIAHLISFSYYGKMYLDKGFLYKKGSYLTENERASLQDLVHR